MQETTFRCPHHHQRYQRADILRRHVKRFCQGQIGAIQDNVPSQKEHRIKVACDLGHEKKLKCTGTVPCRTCEQQGRLCTATRVTNTDRNGSTRLPSAGRFSDIGSTTSFPELHSSPAGTEDGSVSLTGKVHFQDVRRIGDGSFEYRDTGSRNLPQYMLGRSALGGSMHVSATGGLGSDNDTSFNSSTVALVYS